MPNSPDLVSGRGWNFKTWGSLFNPRQLAAMQTFVECLREVQVRMESEVRDEDYRLALATYLGLWIGRIAMFGNSLCRWEAGLERPKTPFGGQAIPMIWDYPEINPFGSLAGTAETQLEYMTKAVGRQNDIGMIPAQVMLGSAASLPLKSDSVDYVITDPPYDDAIAYGDLSDFFYVWLKRGLGDLFPTVFATPLTPKSEEATSIKHRHGGSSERAREHYRKLLKASFDEALRVVRPPKLITVMFAHQSTDAWTALIKALLDSGISPHATWPIATEMPTTALAMGTASLETSVTVACRPRVIGSAEAFRKVREEVENVVKASVERFWSYGFRGSDLVVACYGPAVGVFGKYERVEKNDGTLVSIPELLDLARKAARDAIAGEFRGDSLSTLYYVWSNLYGASEQRWDDARLLVQIGGDSEDPMAVARGHGIFIVDGSKCRLALLADRAKRRGLGLEGTPPLIDALHRAMLLWKQEKRGDLIDYLTEHDLLADDRFWKLAQSLFDALPRDLEDWKLVSAFSANVKRCGPKEKRKALSQRSAHLG